jgi:hypothetical protein
MGKRKTIALIAPVVFSTYVPLIFILSFSTLKMEAADAFETFVTIFYLLEVSVTSHHHKIMT